MRPSPIRVLAPLLFVLSGAAGLLLQVAWLRLLALGLGGTLLAATVDLAVFMAGLALGAHLVGRRASRIRRPLRAYALLEIGAAASALATLPLLRGLDDVYAFLAQHVGDQTGILLAVKVLLACVALLPATTFMGGTLPVLCEALVSRRESAGLGIGGLQALNTAGAVAGTLASIFVVMPRWGLTACVLVAAGIDLLVAVIALALSARESARAVAPVAQAPRSAPRLRVYAAALFLVGAAGMAYEVLWTRALAFYFGSGAHAFALMLAVVLAGYALGAFTGGALSDRTRSPALVLGASQALLAGAVAWFVLVAPTLPDFMYDLAMREGRVTHSGLSGIMLIATAQALLPAAVLMGAALPAAARAVVHDEPQSPGLGDVVGRLAAANALGTVPGAAFALWGLVPALGLQRSLLALALLNAAIAALVFALAPRTRARTLVATSAAVVVVVSLVVVAGRPPRAVHGAAGASALALEESAHGTVTLSLIEDSRGEWLSLEIDAVNVAGTSPPLLACQAMQGHLPLLLNPGARRIAHIGFGSGGTASAVLSWPSVEELHVVEINPAVLATSRRMLAPLNARVFADPRVSFVLADGRNHVIGTQERYDVILSDSIHPRYRGNSSLYTVDYFERCRGKLAPGGLVSTWLPIYSLSERSLLSIVASMRAVFPRTSLWYLNSTVNEFVILIGRTDEAPIDATRMHAALSVPEVATALSDVGVTSVVDVLDDFVAEGPQLDSLVGGVALHFDDHPWVELESAAVLDRDGSWRANLARVVAARAPVAVIGDASLVAAIRRREEAMTHALAGQLALIRGDGDAQRLAFTAANDLAPDARVPWEVFGVPRAASALGAAALTHARTSSNSP